MDLATCQHLELAHCHYPKATLKTPVYELNERGGVLCKLADEGKSSLDNISNPCCDFLTVTIITVKQKGNILNIISRGMLSLCVLSSTYIQSSLPLI